MRKLTVIGVLAALVMGVVGLAQSAGAFSPSYVQSFCTGTASGPCTVSGSTPVDQKYCYGAGNAPNSALACPGTSETNIAAGSAGANIPVYQVIKLPIGSRLTLPITYTPADFGSTNPAPGTFASPVITGDVTAATGVLCDGDTDILADNGTVDNNGTPAPNPTFGGTWPDYTPGSGWNPAKFVRQSSTSGSGGVDVTLSDNSYIDSIKPMPAGFTDYSIDRSNLRRIWLGGTIPYDIPTSHYQTDVPTPTNSQLANAGTPLINIVTNSSYVAGLKVSVAILGGQPDPPTAGYTCLDSPQSSVAQDNAFVAPACGTPPCDFVRWTAFISAADLIDGTTTRILDTSCVRVGTGAPACDLADADGDLVPNAVETVLGTSNASTDSDGDGSTDYDEIFAFTDPNNSDTDGDGSLDKQDNLAGFNCASAAGVCTVANLGDDNTDDNCPVDPNGVAAGGQLNSDSLPDYTNSPNTPAGAIYRGDATNPHQDSQGDACDTDDDNDGMADVVEVGFNHPNVQPGCTGVGVPLGCVGATDEPAAGLYCLSQHATAPSAGMSTVATSVLNPDSDSDGGLDGRECTFGSDPISSVLASCNPVADPSKVNCATADRFPAATTGTDEGDLLFPDAAETFYRTQHIRLSNLAQLDDLESLDAATLALACTDPNATPLRCDNKVGPNDTDSDGDKLNDGVEVKWYATSPAAYDTDGDGCSDGKEAGDVNGDHKVDSTDALGISQHTTTGALAPGGAAIAYPVGKGAGLPAATTLSGAITATADTLTVVSAAGYAPTGKLKINGGEIVVYTGLSGNTFTGVIRGTNSTTWPRNAAVAHAAAESVAAEASAYNVVGTRRTELATYDINKDGKIDSTDSSLRAQIATGSGGGGNCKAGTGAQTGKNYGNCVAGLPVGCEKEQRSSTTVNTRTITTCSVANPTVITTSTPHGFLTGGTVTIAGCAGSTPAIGGTYTITVTSLTTFTIPVNVTVAGAGGTVTG